MNALGCDVSKYNGPVSWPVAAAQGVRFAGIRASISWGYRDPFLAHNQTGTAEQGIHRLYYHVLYPGENVTRQLSNYLQAVNDRWHDARPVLDLELDHGQSKQAITAAVIAWCEQVEIATGLEPIIYSRAQWVNSFTTLGLWRQRWPLWLAQYNFDRTVERNPPPTLPNGAADWLIHQTADKYPAWPGFAAGAGFIETVDINRWNGDNAAVDRFFGVVTAPPLTLEQRVERLEQMAHSHTTYTQVIA